MKMGNARALALVSALFSVECRGCDADGNEVGPERNAHFLDALRVAAPDLPYSYDLLRVIRVPPNASPEDNRRALALAQVSCRLKFAEILRAIADGVLAGDESPSEHR